MSVAALKALPPAPNFAQATVALRQLNDAIFTKNWQGRKGECESELKPFLQDVAFLSSAFAQAGNKDPLLEDWEWSRPQVLALLALTREFGRIFAGYVIAILLLLGGIVTLAGIDFMATRRYALAQLRKIQTDRRAMLERQITRWREERDGPSLN